MTGRKLPAQKSGKIVVGEELILVNNVNVSSLDSLNDLVPMIKKYSDEKKILCLTFWRQILIAMDNNFEDDNFNGNNDPPMLSEEESTLSSASEFPDQEE